MKLKCDYLLSSDAFRFNLRRFTMAPGRLGQGQAAAAATSQGAAAANTSAGRALRSALYVGLTCFAGFQGTSNGGQRCANLRSRVNRRSDLPYNGTIWRFDGLLLENWRPPFEVPWKALFLGHVWWFHQWLSVTRTAQVELRSGGVSGPDSRLRVLGGSDVGRAARRAAADASAHQYQASAGGMVTPWSSDGEASAHSRGQHGTRCVFRLYGHLTHP